MLLTKKREKMIPSSNTSPGYFTQKWNSWEEGEMASNSKVEKVVINYYKKNGWNDFFY